MHVFKRVHTSCEYESWKRNMCDNDVRLYILIFLGCFTRMYTCSVMSQEISLYQWGYQFTSSHVADIKAA